MSSHQDKQVNTEFGQWLNWKYGKHKPSEPIRGKIHDFLRMNFYFTELKVLNIDLCGHDDDMIDSFPIEFEKKIQVHIQQETNYLKKVLASSPLQWQKDYTYPREPDLIYN